MHVLLVTRESGESHRISESIENLGHRVTTQHSGTAALLSIPAAPPHAILCADILPDTDAITLLRSLRESCPEIPIAILTSILTHISDEIALRNAGASSIIASNCDQDSLLIQLSHFLSLPAHQVALPTSQSLDLSYFESLVGRLGTEILDLRAETERYRHEVMHADRLRNVGMFSSGIIHDINNILCGIIGHAELGRFSAQPSDAERYSDIIKGAGRGCELAHQVLGYANRIPQNSTTSHPESSVREALHLIKASIPSTIQLSVTSEPDLPVVRIDENKIHQIVLNLVTNAWHAFDRKTGTISVHLRKQVPSPQHLTRCDTLKEIPYVLLEVKDNASGIPHEIRSRIFQPFFSTKARGKGSGMGLFVVKNLVDHAQGAITVDSEPGFGSTFTVFLPLDKPARSKRSGPAPKTPPAPVGAHILVVDDEELLASVVSEILSNAGHSVTAFTHPAEALLYLESNPKVDAIITDLAMPLIDGFELAKESQLIAPKTPLILLSGNLPLLNKADKERLPLFTATLKKPFTPSELSRTVAEAIQRFVPPPST